MNNTPNEILYNYKDGDEFFIIENPFYYGNKFFKYNEKYAKFSHKYHIRFKNINLKNNYFIFTGNDKVRSMCLKEINSLSYYVFILHENEVKLIKTPFIMIDKILSYYNIDKHYKNISNNVNQKFKIAISKQGKILISKSKFQKESYSIDIINNNIIQYNNHNDIFLKYKNYFDSLDIMNNLEFLYKYFKHKKSPYINDNIFRPLKIKEILYEN